MLISCWCDCCVQAFFKCIKSWNQISGILCSRYLYISMWYVKCILTANWF